MDPRLYVAMRSAPTGNAPHMGNDLDPTRLELWENIPRICHHWRQHERMAAVWLETPRGFTPEDVVSQLMWLLWEMA
jgi:hypothetical protein